MKSSFLCQTRQVYATYAVPFLSAAATLLLCRYIYDKVPCTLSQHLKAGPQQQQQQQPGQQFSLKRYSDQSALDGSHPVDAAADVADTAVASGAGRQYIAYGGTVLPLPHGTVGTTNGSCDASLMGHTKSNPMPILPAGGKGKSHWHGSGFVVVAGEGLEVGPGHRSVGPNCEGYLGTSSSGTSAALAQEEDLEKGGRHRGLLISPSRSLPYDELSRAAAAAAAAGGGVGINGYGRVSRAASHDTLTAAAAAEAEAESAPGARRVYQRHGSAGAVLSDSASTVERGLSPAGSKYVKPLVNVSLSHWANQPQIQQQGDQLLEDNQQQQQQNDKQQQQEEQHIPSSKFLAAAVGAEEQEGGMHRGSSALLSAASGEEQVHGELLYQHSSELLGGSSMEGALSLNSSYGELQESNSSGGGGGSKGLLPSPSGLMQQLLKMGSRGQQDNGEEQLAHLPPQQQQQQHEADGGLTGGVERRGVGAEEAEEGVVAPVMFDLTATGAANPSGLPQSALLDLFADMADGGEFDARWVACWACWKMVPLLFRSRALLLSGWFAEMVWGCGCVLTVGDQT